MKALSLTLSILTLATATQSVNASLPSRIKTFPCQALCNKDKCADRAIWKQCYKWCEPRTIIRCARTAYAKKIITEKQINRMRKVDPSFYEHHQKATFAEPHQTATFAPPKVEHDVDPTSPSSLTEEGPFKESPINQRIPGISKTPGFKMPGITTPGEPVPVQKQTLEQKPVVTTPAKAPTDSIRDFLEQTAVRCTKNDPIRFGSEDPNLQLWLDDGANADFINLLSKALQAKEFQYVSGSPTPAMVEEARRILKSTPSLISPQVKLILKEGRSFVVYNTKHQYQQGMLTPKEYCATIVNAPKR